jgi:putative ABC transport system substrate-binding protein
MTAGSERRAVTSETSQGKLLLRAGFVSICLLHAVFLPADSGAQQRNIPRVGYVSSGSASAPEPLVEAFRHGLRDLEYGKNIVEKRIACPACDRHRRPYRTGALEVDVIVVSSGTIVGAVKQTGTKTPMILTVSADPIGEGLVQSLARPGGNVTGLSDFHGDLIGKRLELLKDIVPSLSRVAFLWNASTTADPRQLKQLQSAGEILGVAILSLSVKHGGDFEDAFAAMKKDRSGAVTLHGDAFISNHRSKILELILKNRLPAIWTVREHVESGGLMS